jgi:hypothetical protein
MPTPKYQWEMQNLQYYEIFVRDHEIFVRDRTMFF